MVHLHKAKGEGVRKGEGERENREVAERWEREDGGEKRTDSLVVYYMYVKVYHTLLWFESIHTALGSRIHTKVYMHKIQITSYGRGVCYY